MALEARTLNAKKAEASAELQTALTTLGLKSVDEFDNATAKSKAFKSEQYDNKITFSAETEN